MDILGNIPVHHIDIHAVQELRCTLENENTGATGKERYRASSTINRHMAHLKTVLNECRKLGYIKMVPEFCMVSERDRRRTRLISIEEERALLAYLRKPTIRDSSSEMRRGLALQIEFLFETGMRLGESLKMEYGRHIQLSRKTIVLTADITKSGATRSIPITKHAHEILQKRYDDNHTDRPFPWAKYYVNKVWNKAKKSIGITDPEFVPHAIRHTVATRLLGNGVSAAKVQKLLGHRNLSTTDIYNQLVAEDIRDDLENLSRRYKRGRSEDENN